MNRSAVQAEALALVCGCDVGVQGLRNSHFFNGADVSRISETIMGSNVIIWNTAAALRRC